MTETRSAGGIDNADAARSEPSPVGRRDHQPTTGRGAMSGVTCTNDCTTSCGRCKGRPYFTKRSTDGRYVFVMWRESAFPAASFNRGDFNDAAERASALTDELNAASAVTNGPDSLSGGEQ